MSTLRSQEQAVLDFDQPLPRTVERFDGETFEKERDGERLTRQLDRVEKIMLDRQWHTLKQMAKDAGGSEASISARLRDLRKTKFGGYTIEREYISNGVFKYRIPSEQ